jgi:hypothetical protein
MFNSMVGYGFWPLWVGTGLIYLAFGLASYAAALVILRRRGGIRDRLIRTA